MSEQDFIAAILSAPNDDAPRLVYADWLEEQGDLRQQFLRLECLLARLHPTIPESTDIRKRLQERFASLDWKWISIVSRAPIVGCRPPELGSFCQQRNWATLPVTEDPDRVCDACGVFVTFVDDIEVIRQTIWGVAAEECVAVDPRVVLSAQALKPSDATRSEIQLHHDEPESALRMSEEISF